VIEATGKNAGSGPIELNGPLPVLGPAGPAVNCVRGQSDQVSLDMSRSRQPVVEIKICNGHIAMENARQIHLLKDHLCFVPNLRVCLPVGGSFLGSFHIMSSNDDGPHRQNASFQKAADDVFVAIEDYLS
jgi:hypothetical protein